MAASRLDAAPFRMGYLTRAGEPECDGAVRCDGVVVWAVAARRCCRPSPASKPASHLSARSRVADSRCGLARRGGSFVGVSRETASSCGANRRVEAPPVRGIYCGARDGDLASWSHSLTCPMAVFVRRRARSSNPCVLGSRHHRPTEPLGCAGSWLSVGFGRVGSRVEEAWMALFFRKRKPNVEEPWKDHSSVSRETAGIPRRAAQDDDWTSRRSTVTSWSPSNAGTCSSLNPPSHASSSWPTKRAAWARPRRR
jgi:hypothetical protein